MKWTNSYRSFGLKTKRSTGLKTIEHKHIFAPAARATQRGLPAPDARHQDRSVAQWGIVDGHVLDDHALDVEQTFEYVLHKAFSVVLFLGRKTNLQETPLTPS